MKALTVMCVDDDAGIRELYGALLGQNGYEVIAASNGRHALHVFESKEEEIDAVILDYEMPGMNGLELATWLKQRHPTLPVLMVSGSHPDLEQMAPFVDATIGKRRSITAHFGSPSTAADRLKSSRSVTLFVIQTSTTPLPTVVEMPTIRLSGTAPLAAARSDSERTVVRGPALPQPVRLRIPHAAASVLFAVAV